MLCRTSMGRGNLRLGIQGIFASPKKNAFSQLGSGVSIRTRKTQSSLHLEQFSGQIKTFGFYLSFCLSSPSDTKTPSSDRRPAWVSE